jgi:glutathione S-transferase
MASTAHPDSDIHPHATGAAARIVAEHQKDEPITLYSGWFCPFVQRSWITLEEKKIPYKYVEINPYNKEPR